MSLCKTCFHGAWARKDPMENSGKDVCEECRFVDAKLTRASNWKPMPQTNADRIRAMSDEELADLLYNDPMCKVQSYCSEYGCQDCILDWLKQPVKDGEGDGEV